MFLSIPHNIKRSAPVSELLSNNSLFVGQSYEDKYYGVSGSFVVLDCIYSCSLPSSSLLLYSYKIMHFFCNLMIQIMTDVIPIIT